MRGRYAGAAEVPDFDIGSYIPAGQRKSLKIMSRAMRFAVGAAGLGIKDAGLELEREDPGRVGVVMGTGLVPVDLPELLERSLLDSPSGLISRQARRPNRDRSKD